MANLLKLQTLLYMPFLANFKSIEVSNVAWSDSDIKTILIESMVSCGRTSGDYYSTEMI